MLKEDFGLKENDVIHVLCGNLTFSFVAQVISSQSPWNQSD